MRTPSRPASRLARLCFLPALLLCAATLPAAAQSAPDTHGFIRTTPEQIKWPEGNGIKTVVLYGDPSKPGMYVVRNTFPPGIMSAPHYHDQDRYVTVIKGTWYTGTDDKWDPATAVGLPAGSYMIHPKGAVHFDGAKDEETIVQITGIGPVKTVSSHPGMPRFGKPHQLK
ncbi:MAG TPA: cupin domain-containing protein [Burkholderiales bacterium]|jgi:quercetin dioxygenase-like cupin family protein